MKYEIAHAQQDNYRTKFYERFSAALKRWFFKIEVEKLEITTKK